MGLQWRRAGKKNTSYSFCNQIILYVSIASSLMCIPSNVLIYLYILMPKAIFAHVLINSCARDLDSTGISEKVLPRQLIDVLLTPASKLCWLLVKSITDHERPCTRYQGFVSCSFLNHLKNPAQIAS